MGVQRYRLEIAIKKVRGVTGFKEIKPKTSVVVQFLDFPDIVIYPLGECTSSSSDERGQDIRFSVSHKADFLLDDVLKQCVFPTQCFCTLAEFTGKDKARAVGRWTTVCPFTSPTVAAEKGRSYNTLSIRNSNGDTIGTVEMSSRVVFSPDAKRSITSDSGVMRVAHGLTVPERPRGLSEEDVEPQKNAPQTIRVVVREREAAETALSPVAPPAPAPAPAAPLIPAERSAARSLLSVLRYDVAYQLQSTSETLAATLKREEELLCISPCKVCAKGLLRVIDKRVQKVLKISNIVLQVANRLSDKPTNGTARDVPSEVDKRFRRNPVNKIKTPVDKSIGYYLMFDVLFQLQCVETHLSYLLEAYEKELNVPISSVDPAAISYCNDFEKQVHGLIKYANILVQSAIDGRLGEGGVSKQDLDCSYSSDSVSSEDNVRPKREDYTSRGHRQKKSRTTKSSSKQAPKHLPKQSSKHPKASKRDKPRRKRHSSSSDSSSTVASMSSSTSSESQDSRDRRRAKAKKPHRSRSKSRRHLSVSEEISAVLPLSALDPSRRRSMTPLRPSTTTTATSSSTNSTLPPPGAAAPPPPVIYQWNTTVSPGMGGQGVTTTHQSYSTPFQQRLENYAFGQQPQPVAVVPSGHLDYSSDSDFYSSSSSYSSSSDSADGRRTNPRRSHSSSQFAVIPVQQPSVPYGPIVKNPPFNPYPSQPVTSLAAMNTMVPPPPPEGTLAYVSPARYSSGDHTPHGHRAIPVTYGLQVQQQGVPNATMTYGGI